jgi:uncharacterized protein
MDNSPLQIAVGGALLGLGSILILMSRGRLAGVSSLMRGAIEAARGDRAWRISALAGMATAGLVASVLDPRAVPGTEASPLLLVISGLLVGAGARLGNGCTSGHGVCGVGRASPRSIVATVMFSAAGMAFATTLRLV